MRLDAGTVLLQWATGGLFFLWVTTRRREVGLGYGWLLRGVFLVMAAGAAAVLAAGDRGGGGGAVRTAGAIGALLPAAGALAISIARRGGGVPAPRRPRTQPAGPGAA